MNFLNNAIAQVGDLFRSMTPGARVTAALLLAVVAVSFGYLVRQGAAGPDAFLFGGEAFSDSQLTRMEAALGAAKLTGWVREGNRLRVPAGQQAEYVAAVADAGALPPNFNTILQDAIGSASPFETRDTTNQRFKDARQRQLSEIVRAMNWVEEAVVIYDEQEAKGINRQRQVTASVSVKPEAGEIVDAKRADNLRKLISSAILGLQPDKVVVTNLNGGSDSGSGGAMDPALFDNPYYQVRVQWEQYRRENILRLLSYIPGVLVEVNAELDDTAAEETTNMTPTKGVNVRTEETRQGSKQKASEGGGRPGVVPNTAVANNVAEGPQSQTINETESTTEKADIRAGAETMSKIRQGFTPKVVLASVGIPSSYFESVWKERNRTATEPPKPEDLTPIKTEVIRNVEDMVENMLVKNADRTQDTFKRVKVVALDALPVPTIQAPSIADKAISWTGRYWNTFAMLGVAMFSLMVLRSVVKSVPPTNAAPNAPAVVAPALTLAAEEPTAPGQLETAADQSPRPRLRLKKGTNLKDDLVEIVREDPDAAADILRSWIGKAG